MRSGPKRSASARTRLVVRLGEIQRQVGPMQKPMEGDEARIFDNAAQLGKGNRRGFPTSRDLTSDLKTAMRKERMTNGKTPALARMAQLLKTTENVIKNAATQQSAKEAEEDMGQPARNDPAGPRQHHGG